MATPKTDTSGQVVQPRAITHFGDGATPLTNRDVSLDLKALIDDSIKGLLRSLGDAGAAPTNYTSKTVLKLLEDIRAAVAAGLGLPLADKIVGLTTVSVPAATTVNVPWQPAAGEVWQYSYAWMYLDADTVNSWVRVYLQGDGTLSTPRLASQVGGTTLEVSYAATSPLYTNNTAFISLWFRNENASVAKEGKYLISGVKVK